MTNTIPNVPRELLERARAAVASTNTSNWSSDLLRDIHAILSAPSPAGVDGLVRNFKTREGYDVWDKLCAIPKFGFLIGLSGGVVKVADIGNWIDRDEAQSVVDEAQCEVNLLRHEASDAQAIIDGLRGEVEELRAESFESLYNAVIDERDQHAQRIGELEGLLLESLDTLESTDDPIENNVEYVVEQISNAVKVEVAEVVLYATRQLSGRELIEMSAIKPGDFPHGIDAALSAGKEGE